MSAASEVLDTLARLGIEYRCVAHAPAYTMADCAELDARLNALTPKNLFLTTKNGKRFYLCLARPEARFKTSDISKQAGSPRLSFAPEEILFQKLRCHGGSASPLGLIFPESRGVGLLIDSALKDAPTLAFHPCDNTQTVLMSGQSFFQIFLTSLNITPLFVDFQKPSPLGEGGLREAQDG